MRTEIHLIIDFGEDRAAAEAMYAEFVGTEPHMLHPRNSPGYVFSGACVPSIRTGYRKAFIELSTLERG